MFTDIINCTFEANNVNVIQLTERYIYILFFSFYCSSIHTKTTTEDFSQFIYTFTIYLYIVPSFKNNELMQAGGALSILSLGMGSLLSINNSVFIGNYVRGSDNFPYGKYPKQSKLCCFTFFLFDWQTSAYGGAIAMMGLSLTSAVVNSTFRFNSAIGGFGLYSSNMIFPPYQFCV